MAEPDRKVPKDDYVDEARPDDKLAAPARKEREKEQNKLARPDAVGKNEKGAEAAVPNLDIKGPIQADKLDELEEKYILYAAPMRQTLRALGRVNDLTATGIPRHPALLGPELRAPFDRVKEIEKGPSARDAREVNGAAAAWQEGQQNLHVAQGGYLNAREQLQASVHDMMRLQEKLNQKMLRKAKEAKMAEVAAIEEAAMTLIEIVKTVKEAVELAADVEGLEKMIEFASNKVGDKVKQIDLKYVFIKLMGDGDKYDKLQRDIKRCDAAIARSEENEEKNEFAAVRDRLHAWSFTVGNLDGDVQIRQDLTRMNAVNFADAVGGGNKTRLVALIADGYQSLDTCADSSLQSLQALIPVAQVVYDWCSSDEARKRYLVAGRDLERMQLQTIFQTVYGLVKENGRRDFLEKEAPIWHETADAWRKFLAETTQRRFGGQTPEKQEGG